MDIENRTHKFNRNTLKCVFPAILLGAGTIFGSAHISVNADKAPGEAHIVPHTLIAPHTEAAPYAENDSATHPDIIFNISLAEVSRLTSTPGSVWILGDSHGQFVKSTSTEKKAEGLAPALMEQAVNNYGVKLAMSGNTTVTEERSGVVIKSDAVPGQTTPHLLDSLKKAPSPKSTEKKMVVVSTGTNNVWIEGYDVPTQMKDIQSVIDILSMSAPNALIVVMQPPTVFEKRYGVDVESRLRMFRQKLALLLKDPKNAHVRLLFEQSEDGSIPELTEDDFQKDPSGKPDLHLVPRWQDGILRGNEKAANKLAELGLMRATNPQITYIPTIFK